MIELKKAGNDLIFFFLPSTLLVICRKDLMSSIETDVIWYMQNHEDI